MNDQTTNYPSLSPALAVHSGADAIKFYQAAFGATELFRLTDPETGKVGHAELLINGSLVMLADEYPTHNKSPRTLGGTSVKLSLMVGDVDAALARAQSAGATVLMPAVDQFYGYRSASVRDPFGHEWQLQCEIEKVLPSEMQRRWDAMSKKC